jgi:RNA polymerase sigma-70 factor (ECF subfamily)
MAEDTKPEESGLGLLEGDLSAAVLATKPAPATPVVTGGREIVDEDHDLVQAARAGDRAAFTRLFERHHGRVYAMCARLLRDRTEVEDAVQTAFLEAWKSLHRFEGRSRFSTWVTRIAIHTCLGIRRRLKRLLLPTDDLIEPSEDERVWGERPVAPDEGAAHRDRRRAVANVLDQLSAKKRVVFVLSELEGMTAPEIGEILEIPDATVRTRLFHARKDIARLIRNHPGFADLFADGRRS